MYLREIGQVPLLKAEDEVRLAKRIEAGMAASEQLADLAQQAGANRAAVADCMDQGTFADWVTAATEQASKDGINATPTILVDGNELEFTQNQDPRVTLEQAVQAAS